MNAAFHIGRRVIDIRIHRPQPGTIVQAQSGQLEIRWDDGSRSFCNGEGLFVEPGSADEEVACFHRLLLDRTGATQIEPVDVIMGRWLNQLAELEAHHREHHNCLHCRPCPTHRDEL